MYQSNIYDFFFFDISSNFFLAVSSISDFNAANSEISPKVVFSILSFKCLTSFLDELPLDFGFEEEVVSFLASSYVLLCETIIFLLAFENSITLKSSFSSNLAGLPSSFTK